MCMVWHNAVAILAQLKLDAIEATVYNIVLGPFSYDQVKHCSISTGRNNPTERIATDVFVFNCTAARTCGAAAGGAVCVTEGFRGSCFRGGTLECGLLIIPWHTIECFQFTQVQVKRRRRSYGMKFA